MESLLEAAMVGNVHGIDKMEAPGENGEQKVDSEVYGYIDILSATGKPTTTYKVDQTLVTLGRDTRSNIRFDIPKLSRNQCEIIIKRPLVQGEKMQVTVYDQ